MPERAALSPEGEIVCAHCLPTAETLPAGEDAVPAECDRCRGGILLPPRYAWLQPLQRRLRYVNLDARLSGEEGGTLVLSYRQGVAAKVRAAEQGVYAVRFVDAQGEVLTESGELKGTAATEAYLRQAERRFGRALRVRLHHGTQEALWLPYFYR